MFPEAVVVGSKVCLAFLAGLAHSTFESRAVKGGDTVDLGGGHVLEFVMAPNLHCTRYVCTSQPYHQYTSYSGPDTMFSYDQATGVMYTCDAFGMHFCSEELYDSELETIAPHYRFYYDCLMKPNSRSVLTALRKVKDLQYNTIATGHGPVLRYNMPELVQRSVLCHGGISTTCCLL